MPSDPKSTVTRRLGTPGLMVAIRLYGRDCIRSVGDWLTPAEVDIPLQDADAFDALVREATHAH
jgi:hypothetical protein